MKKIILIVFGLLPLLILGQNCINSKLDRTILHESFERAGTCASPDGVDKSIPFPPPDYNYLNTNGYCYTVSPAVKDFVACYTMTAGATSVDFNAGYNATGCTGLLINYAILYTTGACVIVDGTALGTTTGLTIGSNYTWCISLKCTGPGPGFSTFCPYYQNIVPLPVELIGFECLEEERDIQLKWRTMSETNNDHFDINRSIEGINFTKIGEILGNGNSTTPKDYAFRDFFPLSGENYYQLVQYDYNGNYKHSNSIECNFTNKEPYTTTYYDIVGREINISDCKQGFYLVKLINGENVQVQIHYKQ